MIFYDGGRKWKREIVDKKVIFVMRYRKTWYIVIVPSNSIYHFDSTFYCYWEVNNPHLYTENISYPTLFWCPDYHHLVISCLLSKDPNLLSSLSLMSSFLLEHSTDLASHFSNYATFVQKSLDWLYFKTSFFLFQINLFTICWIILKLCHLLFYSISLFLLFSYSQHLFTFKHFLFFKLQSNLYLSVTRPFWLIQTWLYLNVR